MKVVSPDQNRSQPRDRARQLRRTSTDAERLLWRCLRERLPLEGTYFRREVPLGPYFADFACLKYRLVIELDGSQHGIAEGMDADTARTRFLEQSGFRVLRFWNRQVFTETDAVIETIGVAPADPHPQPLSARERGTPP